VSRIIDSGTTPNVKDDDGVPALMLATLFADTACVELLLKRIVVGPNASVPGATGISKAAFRSAGINGFRRLKPPGRHRPLR
jgi:ankyrin repeat protein